MLEPDGFWLRIHQLAESYDGQGAASNERTENILAAFQTLPPSVQRGLLTDLFQVVTYVPDIYPLAVAAANTAEQSAKQMPKGAAG